MIPRIFLVCITPSYFLKENMKNRLTVKINSHICFSPLTLSTLSALLRYARGVFFSARSQLTSSFTHAFTFMFSSYFTFAMLFSSDRHTQMCYFNSSKRYKIIIKNGVTFFSASVFHPRHYWFLFNTLPHFYMCSHVCKSTMAQSFKMNT